ncbi:DUF6988 family protein [Burkholderia gladioli]|uniref:DUF6988 family protein n=1 Tax=Burkholderia gladioli TaxID=28095 RepID=UPI001C25EA6B|nr:hypothetical protein [Burkholderia gladioli]MBU9382118.1 hypothetical protein [Burkholderia gladioli]
MTAMVLKSEIEKTVQWCKVWREVVQQAKVGAEVRSHMSGAFQHLCLEHHTGLLRLAEVGIYGAAFALYRPQFDAFVRGAWIRACASDVWIGGFQKNEKQPPVIKNIINSLEKVDGYEDGLLTKFRETAYGLLCDFTHGGTVQVRMRVAPGSIKMGWSEDHVAGLLRSSSALALLGCIEISRLAKDEEMANEFAFRHKSIYSIDVR